jgi:murein DD-endopeptidase MepM/ murein hydrolase activator NlpD
MFISNALVIKRVFYYFYPKYFILRQLFIVLSFVTGFISFSQNKYPQNYFRSPVDIPIVLSGTFGELRSNHFHAGLDIKTQGKEGLPVFAVADGYVSRIKVGQYGYGKAIYITHPNGYTSVYGHLQKYKGKIQDYVKSIQYKKENYETGNLFFKEDKFPVKKGDQIAISGNTGGSGGPHLHYEIRDTKTSKIINPLFFGLMVKDDIKPTIQGIKIYPLQNDSRVNSKNIAYSLPIKKITDGKYKTDEVYASNLVGFGIQTYDRLNNASNKNGVYSIEMTVNNKRFFYHEVETFSFAETKFINLHIDYPFYKKYKKRFEKTHKAIPNKLSTYKGLINNGIINVKEGLSYQVKIIVKDFAGNISTINVPLIGVKNNTLFSSKDTTAYKIEAKKFHKFSKNGVTVAFPKNTFYKDNYINFSVENNSAKVHEDVIPLNKSFTLTFNVNKFSSIEKQFLYIAKYTSGKYSYYVNTRKKDSTFFTTTKTLGKYGLKKDTIKPTIKPLYFKENQNLNKHKTLKVKIGDVGSGIKNYRATIDDNWILMEYNHKKSILTYDFNDKKLVGNKHIFKIVVSDNVGNTKTLSASFYKNN